MTKETSIQDSLWTRCFWIIAEKEIQQKRKNIQFSKVDELVLAKSRLPTAKLIEFLQEKPKE